MAYQYYCVGTGREEVFQPLNTLDVKVIGRLIEQQHIGTGKQEFCQLNTHAPATGKLTGGAVEVLTTESQTLQGPFYFGTEVGTAHHQETFVLMGEAVDKFMVIFAVVIGAFGKLPVHAFDVGLHLEDVFKGKFGFLHHRVIIAEDHHLGQVTDSTFTRNCNNAGSGLLQASQYFKHGRFARTILAHQGDTVFFVDNVRDVFEQRRGVEFHLQSFY